MQLTQPFSGSPTRSAASQDIAIIGSGISGLSAAWLLGQDHNVTLFEANDYLGGHSHTVDVSVSGKTFPVDTGFIVFNPTNYPNLTALFDLLDVATTPSDMSFSASLDNGRFEYAGGTGFGLLAQPSNLVHPAFWRMLAGIVRFYHNSTRYAHEQEFAHMTLGELLSRQNYSDAFVQRHIAPMGAAIWSSDCRSILDYPAQSFIRFFDNHGLTRFAGRPQWRTVTGGSRQYVARLAQRFRRRARLSTPVDSVRPEPVGVAVNLTSGEALRFDHVVFACHSDQALALIDNPDAERRRALGDVRYRSNEVVLHTDVDQMPKRRGAWASWNFIQGRDGRCMVSYWMNRLQPLPVAKPVIVTLNPHRAINRDSILDRFEYAHPAADGAALAARRRIWHLQGRDHLWFCGAWLGDGFHEDGIQAGLAVAEMLGTRARPWCIPGQNGRIGLADKVHAPESLAA